ncbi:MAG: 16S rRNA (uracil(1498)-N(3))-methyltransferase [Melioribacteraceae bacterium]|nr:16S rRNA (uracil(1498)-N(3))-methyltransferase [Melioribacteraceae bacterium]
MKQEYLSDIELYFTTDISNESLIITGDEFKHITKVMRHSVGDTLHITDGSGNYFETVITEITKSSVSTSIRNRKKHKNKFSNIYFCFPRLKSNNRFEFELEKSIELGITNFIIIDTERTIPKGAKMERWNKIALSAMKQSLRTYMPKIEYQKSLRNINSLKGEKIILDQKSLIDFGDFIKEEENSNRYFIFGPEGGLSEMEIETIDNAKIVCLTNNRLRAETAVVTAASAISLINKNTRIL